MKILLHYIGYELSALVRIHRRTLAVLVLLPCIYNLLFGGMFSPNIVTDVPIGIVNLDRGSCGRDIVRELTGVREVSVVFQTGDEAAGQEALRSQRIWALVIIPPDFSADIHHYRGTKVAVLAINTNTLLGGTTTKSIQTVIAAYSAKVQAEQALASGISRPVAPKITMSLRSLYNSTGGYVDFFVAVLLVHALQIAVVFSVGPMWYLDIRRRRHELARHGLSVIVAKWMVYASVETVVLAGCLGFSYAFFGLTIRTSICELMVLLWLFSAAITAFALMVGSGVCKIMNAVTFPLFYIMPSVLFSGAIWPRYAMDNVSLALTYIMPIGYSANTLRDLLLRGSAPSFYVDTVCLSIFALIMLAGTMRLCRRRRNPEKGSESNALSTPAGM